MREVRGARIFAVPIMAIVVAFGKILEKTLGAFIIIVVATLPLLVLYGVINLIRYLVFGAPFIWLSIADMPPAIYLPIFVICATATFLFLVVFDVSIPATISIKLVLRVIKLKKRQVLPILGLYLTLLSMGLGWYTDSVFYGNVIVGVVLSIVVGMLIGIAFAHIDRDRLLANLYWIAKARCLIRMNCDFEASFPLREVHEKRYDDSTVIENLHMATSLISERKEVKQRRTLFLWTRSGPHFRAHRISQEDITACINDLRVPLIDDEYREIISDNIEKTKNLMSFS